ncbi:transcriptional regulator AsnC [Sphingobacteriales bacterium UPWRP_1]|nr:transcriptional regulator AsnC [Sphingobacteriales bacterium TSM_CSS]PSJ72624.1 transcriptional regulator AsnC [Sphingobacteriales bacterium UPWRP_1]
MNYEIDKPEQLKIDKLDLQILSILIEDARVPYTKIGESLFVSAGTVHVRIKKMEQMGIVKGQQLIIDPLKLGYDISAFIGIYLQQSSMYEEVVAQLKNIPEIVSLNYTTGIYSIFLKIICRDTNHLKDLLHDKIQNVKGIQRTETFISLEERINRQIKLIATE